MPRARRKQNLDPQQTSVSDVTSDIERVLRDHLSDHDSSFSIGSYGAIAEFHRDAAEPLAVDARKRLMVGTDRGAIRIVLPDGVLPVAYETPGRRPDSWQHGVVFCRPGRDGVGAVRSTLTELGPDREAIVERDRDAILFDMGLGARNVDFCVRVRDAELISLLRDRAGRSVLEPGNPVMDAIVEASPHRVAVSILGRIEVYQPIGKVKTPDGPHTHVLPKLLAGARTHAATIPVPTGWVPCLSLYPPHPLSREAAREGRFDPARHAAFQALLEKWGPAGFYAEKTAAQRAIIEGRAPEAYEAPKTRPTRAALRVALRQMWLSDPEYSAMVDRWLRFFDGEQRGASAAV